MKRTLVVLLLSSFSWIIRYRMPQRFGATSSLSFPVTMTASFTSFCSDSILFLRTFDGPRFIPQHGQLWSPSQIGSCSGRPNVHSTARPAMVAITDWLLFRTAQRSFHSTPSYGRHHRLALVQDGPTFIPQHGQLWSPSQIGSCSGRRNVHSTARPAMVAITDWLLFRTAQCSFHSTASYGRHHRLALVQDGPTFIPQHAQLRSPSQIGSSSGRPNVHSTARPAMVAITDWLLFRTAQRSFHSTPSYGRHHRLALVQDGPTFIPQHGQLWSPSQIGSCSGRPNVHSTARPAMVAITDWLLFRTAQRSFHSTASYSCHHRLALVQDGPTFIPQHAQLWSPSQIGSSSGRPNVHSTARPAMVAITDWLLFRTAQRSFHSTPSYGRHHRLALVQDGPTFIPQHGQLWSPSQIGSCSGRPNVHSTARPAMVAITDWLLFRTAQQCTLPVPLSHAVPADRPWLALSNTVFTYVTCRTSYRGFQGSHWQG